MTSYGCHNRAPLRDTAIVQDGWVRIGWVGIGHHHEARQTVAIPDEMTKDCQYRHTDLGKADKKCEGCKWR